MKLLDMVLALFKLKDWDLSEHVAQEKKSTQIFSLHLQSTVVRLLGSIPPVRGLKLFSSVVSSRGGFCFTYMHLGYR